MSRNYALTLAVVIGISVAIAAIPAHAQTQFGSFSDRENSEQTFLGDIDIDELDDDQREKIFERMEEFRDELEDVIGERDAEDLLEALRDGDDIRETLSDLDLSFREKRRLRGVMSSFKSDIEDIRDDQS